MKEKFKKYGKWFFESFIWLGLLLLIIDIVTKLVVVANKDVIRANGGIVLIPGFLRINYLINNNFVFGLTTGSDELNRIIFCIIALTVTAGIIAFMVKKWDKLDKFFKACLMMIISGALGNVIDRIFYTPAFLANPVNGVVDWIDFYGVWAFNFNIADSAVVVAAFMLIGYMIVSEIKDYKEKAKDAPKEDNTKVLSKSEQEKQKLLEEDEHKENE